MAGDIKSKWGSSSAFTVTNLHSLSSSSGLDAGWTGGSVDSSSSDVLDWHLTGQFTTASSNRQAGSIYLYAYAAMDDTPTWPDLFSSGTEGTEGAATVHDTEQRDCGMVLVGSPIIVDSGASEVYALSLRGLKTFFSTDIPPKLWAPWITLDVTSTGAGLASSGNSLTRRPVLAQWT